MEERDQEVAVEPEEPVRALPLPNHPEAIGQILRVIVQEALLLDEVEEDQPVEQDGRVEVPILVACKPPD